MQDTINCNHSKVEEGRNGNIMSTFQSLLGEAGMAEAPSGGFRSMKRVGMSLQVGAYE
jgi:hypothetical protein